MTEIVRGTERDGGKEKIEKVKAERLGEKTGKKMSLATLKKHHRQRRNNSSEFPRLQEFLWECRSEG